ncbi:protein-disulfide reductase DsbD domain-containing protein [Brevifollis gellanilyticus]|nr:protein-disulfide reductase DsbD domain-containing protein [Brevifollis gellanilyticus]
MHAFVSSLTASLGIAVLSAVLPCLSLAQDVSAPENRAPTAMAAMPGVKLTLASETLAIVPGQTFRVGIFLQHEKGWHTYWRQPGIVGVPTSMEWKLPPGFKAGPLEYPEPEATKMFQIRAQGYERDVLLQAQIQAPANLQPGMRVTIAGQATWMACGNTCHPGSTQLSLTLPVAAQAEPDPMWQPAFVKERAAYARQSDAWTATAEEKGLNVTLVLRPASKKARAFNPADKSTRVIFFTEDGWINSDQDQTVTLAQDGSLVIHLVRAEVFLGKGTPSKLLGVVQREGGWHTDGSLRSISVQPELRR